MDNDFDCRTPDRTPHTVAPCLVPKSALLQRYVDKGSYVDCYATDIAGPVTQAEFIEAFYTTPVFRLERLILSWGFRSLQRTPRPERWPRVILTHSLRGKSKDGRGISCCSAISWGVRGRG